MPKKLIKTYTVPKIVSATKTRKGFVFFRFFHGGKWCLVRRHPLLSDKYIKREEEQALRDLRDALLFKLDIQGWNPITKEHQTPQVESEVDRLKKLTFAQALDFAYQKKKPEWKYKSAQDYASKIKYLKKGAAKCDFAQEPCSTFRLAHFKLIMDETKKLRKLSATAWNGYRDYLSTLVSEMVQYGIVELNYVQHIKTMRVEKVKAHRPPTQDERLLIVEKIKNQKRPYFRFLCLIYGCGIRPKEIIGLKIRDLHKLEGLIKIPKEVGKTGYREVTVPDWVMGLLSEMNLHNYRAEDYLFSGSPMFEPGRKKMGLNASNRYWRTLVKQDLKLDTNQYGLKKLSADDLVKLQRREGTEGLLKLAQEQFGHATAGMTENYTDAHKEIIHEVVKTRMPEL